MSAFTTYATAVYENESLTHYSAGMFLNCEWRKRPFTQANGKLRMAEILSTHSETLEPTITLK